MAIDFIKKEWKDYPDTSTPITAVELNRIELTVKQLCEAILNEKEISTLIGEKLKSTLTYFGTQLCGTCNVLADWESFPGELRGYGISKEHYNPDKDVLMLWVDNELWELGKDYTLTDDGDYWRVACGSSKYGVNLTVQIWNVEKGKTATSGQAIVLSSGTAESIDGKSYVNLTGTAESVSGRAGKVIEVESGTVNLLNCSLVVDKLGSPINNIPNVTVSERFAIPEGKKVTVYADYDGRKNFDLNFNFIESEDGKEYYYYGKTPYDRGIASGQTLIRPHLFLDDIDSETFDISKLTEFYMTVE